MKESSKEGDEEEQFGDDEEDDTYTDTVFNEVSMKTKEATFSDDITSPYKESG